MERAQTHGGGAAQGRGGRRGGEGPCYVDVRVSLDNSTVVWISTSRCRINATVIGSKYVKEGEEHEGEKEGTGEHAAEEPSGEAAGSKHGESSPGAEAKESEDNPPASEEHTED